MNTKLLFFDIDNTIADEETGKIPVSTRNALNQAQANGHLCFINTGRPISNINNDIKQLNFDGYICGCGTYVQFHDKTIFHISLNEKIRKDIVHLVYQCNVEAFLEGQQATYMSTNIRNKRLLDFKESFAKNNIPIYEFNEDDDVIFDKLTVWYDEASDIEGFKDYLKNYFEIIQRDEDFIEVVPLGYSKATGIQFLVDYLNMDMDDTICFGDSTNDIAMLSTTKESVAMGNSNPLLFDKVTYITSDINDDGIYNALKHFALI